MSGKACGITERIRATTLRDRQSNRCKSCSNAVNRIAHPPSFPPGAGIKGGKAGRGEVKRRGALASNAAQRGRPDYRENRQRAARACNAAKRAKKAAACAGHQPSV